MMPVDVFKRRVGELVRTLRASRPLPGGPPVRIPGEQSRRRREEGRASGMMDVDDEVYHRLLAL